jgi:SET domain-containing protein
MSGVSPRPSRIHGTGLFAERAFAPGEIVAVYHGPVVSDSPAPDAQGRIHAMELSPGRWIDGSGADNLARHANHSCDPNTDAVPAGDVVRLVARRQISAGDEVTFDYGFGLADALDHRCRCGAPSCPGRIVAEPLRAALRRHLPPQKPRD